MDDADDRGTGATLFVSADTKSGETGQREGKIVVSMFEKMLHVPFGCESVDFLYERIGVGGGELFREFQDGVIFLVGKRAPSDDENIGRLIVYRVCEKGNQFHCGNLRFCNVFVSVAVSEDGKGTVVVPAFGGEKLPLCNRIKGIRPILRKLQKKRYLQYLGFSGLF